jgi:glycine betaine/proline transport system substrate-binding protein
VSRWLTRLWSLALVAGVVAGVFYVFVVERERSAAPGKPEALAVSSSIPAAESAAPPAAARETIRIGWTAWADAEIVARVVERILEERLERSVDLLMSDIGIQYQGLESGDLDVMLMAWLPNTHEAFYAKVCDAVVNLGPIYTRAHIGWVVPDYVSRNELGSIEDLARPDVQGRLGGEIQGIDPGSGLMQASERAMGAYGLSDMRLVASSGAAMTAALARAIRDRRWIVATAWSPHWMFARWHLRYLDDPKGVFGSEERVHALISRRFAGAGDTEAVELLTRMFIPRPELERAMLEATERDVDRAVDGFLERERDRVRYWVTGELASTSATAPSR